MMFKKIENFDLKVISFFNAHKCSPQVNRFLNFYVRLGDGYVWALIIAIVIYSHGFWNFLHVVPHILIAILISLLLYWAVKYSVRRKRPFDACKEISAEVPPLDKYSFPSGHTMNNLAIACTAFSIYPSICWIMLLLPVTWGLLRVYFGVHYLTDIIGGILLGILAFLISLPISTFVNILIFS